VPPNRALREKLEKKTTPQLFKLLQKLDPRRAKNIDAHNPVRLVRAIEIATKLGKVPVPKPEVLPYTIEWIGLNPHDELLRNKIAKRLAERMKSGMVAEAKNLHAKGLSWRRMHQLGLEYRYLALYLQKKITKAELTEELEKRIWDYARRQRMYWKRNKDIVWLA